MNTERMEDTDKTINEEQLNVNTESNDNLIRVYGIILLFH